MLISKLLMEFLPNCHLLGVLIVTFTEAAASEMKERIHGAIEKALEDAKNFSIAPGTLQYQIDELVDALEKAHAALVTTAPGASVLQVETLRDSFRSGKSVIFYVTTGPDVTALTVTCDGQPVVLTSCDGEVQTLDGQTVKRWMVAFTAPAPGSYTYTLTDGTNERTIPVTVD